MLGVYLVLFVGMGIAFLTLLAEIYWKRRAKQGVFQAISDCCTVSIIQMTVIDYIHNKKTAVISHKLCFPG